MRAVEHAAFVLTGDRAALPEVSSDLITECLTDRELEVFLLIGEGFSTKEIATKLNRSGKTVEAHKATLKRKLSLANATELARDAVRWVVVRAA